MSGAARKATARPTRSQPMHGCGSAGAKATLLATGRREACVPSVQIRPINSSTRTTNRMVNICCLRPPQRLSLTPGNLGAGATCLRQTDRDRLLTARDLPAGASAPQFAALHLVHRAANLPAAGAAVSALGHDLVLLLTAALPPHSGKQPNSQPGR